MSHRILIALEDETLRRLALHTLEGEGHAVRAVDARDGLESVLRAEPFDLLLTDLDFPGSDPESFLRGLQEFPARPEVLYIVSYRSLGPALSAMRAGAYGFVSKPVDWEEVRLVVARALERHDLLRERAVESRPKPQPDPDLEPRPESERPLDPEPKPEPEPQPEPKPQPEPQPDPEPDPKPEPKPQPQPETLEERSPPTGAAPPVRRIELSYEPDALLGSSDAIAHVRRKIRDVSASTHPVLIEGDRGTGKQQVARAIHYGSERARGPLLEVDAASASLGSIEGDLRGFARGSRDDVLQHRPGWIEKTHGGTLVLRNPDALPRSVQEHVCAFLSTGMVEPIPGTAPAPPVRVDARILFISDRPLVRMLDVGALLPELARHLVGLCIHTPSLRERPSDLADVTAARLRCLGASEDVLADETLPWLERQPWPGNLSELDEAIRRAFWFAEDPEHLRPADFAHVPAPVRKETESVPREGKSSDDAATGRENPSATERASGFVSSPDPSGPFPPATDRPDTELELDRNPEGEAPGPDPSAHPGKAEPFLPDSQEAIRLPRRGLDLVDLEKQLIREALDRTNGNQTQAARMLGLTRQTLIYRMQKHGIDR